MREVLLPRTVLGRWSTACLIAFAVFFALFSIMAAAGVSIGSGADTFFGNLALAVPLLLAAFCGSAAFICGIIAITVKKDFTLLVVLAVVTGFSVLFFALGEFLFEH